MIGICIKYFHENYGGMLQAFATIKMLEERGIEYELIQYEKEKTIARLLASLPRLLNGVLLNDKYEAFLKKMGTKMHPAFANENLKRMNAFDSFRSTYFTRLSPVFRGFSKLCDGTKRYNAVVTGSDQLWSPAGLPTNYYNLMFVPDSIKKISYASSFGVKNIPWYQKKRTAAFLERIDHISMRENRGAEIVYELTGKEVPVVLDPVFNFDCQGWNNLIPFHKEINEPYIFAYFLGNNPAHRDVVNKAAKKLGIKIVALRHLDQYVSADEKFGDYAPYDVGPDRFLNLLRGAEYVCTDSFHGSCFSIINEKKFIVFNRYSDQSKHSKNTRIDSLCTNLGLNQRRYSNNRALEEQLTDSISYHEVYQKLESIKKISDEYLEEALGGLK